MVVHVCLATLMSTWLYWPEALARPYHAYRSRHNVLVCRSGAPAAEQPRINGMALWPVGNLLWPILGALAYSTA